jgi:protein-tyrosine kinase
MSNNFELLRQLDSDWITSSSGHDTTSSLSLAPAAAPKVAVGAHTYEQLNKLVQRLFLSNTDKRCVLFVGAAAGAGCTWVTVHAAKVLCSQTNAQVCIVEASPVRSWLRTHFDVGHHEGARKARVDEEPNCDSAQKVGGNLWIVPAQEGPTVDLAFSPQRIEARVLDLRREFNYVLVDAPPASGSSCCLSLGPLVDGAVLVLKAGHTRRPAVQRAVNEFENAGIRVLGAVLNQREYPIPASIYKRL